MHESAVRFSEYPVPLALAPYVKCIWSQESDQPILDASRERILPDSCVELVFHFHDPFRTHFADGTNAMQSGSFVVGQMKRFLEIEPAGRMGLIAVRFYARGAYLFFERPLSEVAAGIVDLKDIWKERANELTGRIALASGMTERVRLIEETLLALLARNGHFDATVNRALQLIETNCGQLHVAQLAKDLGVSSRQLTRRFQQTIGLSPKEFSRVSRFLNALRSMSNQEHSTLTATALACGYFDQAHFNHEFLEMAGMAPGDLLKFPNVAF
jgi:AraC-like DNA-binding protein